MSLNEKNIDQSVFFYHFQNIWNGNTKSDTLTHKIVSVAKASFVGLNRNIANQIYCTAISQIGKWRKNQLVSISKSSNLNSETWPGIGRLAFFLWMDSKDRSAMFRLDDSYDPG